MKTTELSSPLSTQQALAFPPDPDRAALLYGRIKSRLTESFRQIAAATSSVAEIDETRLAAFLDSLSKAQKISPRYFAIYHEMLVAADEDDPDAISRLFAELTTAESSSGAVPSRNLTDEHLGLGNAARYKSWADLDPENPLSLVALSPEEFQRMASAANEAFLLMDAGAPEVSGEIRALLAEVVFAAGGAGENLIFHGISSFYLWGTVFLNAQGHRTPLEVAQTLAHESSHMHLFAAALDSPLVENPEEERYASPLRLDARPMDGIYHAAYVSARMHYLVTRLLASGVLSPAQIEEATKAQSTHAKSFREGYQVVLDHGHLTELGQALLANAHSYMATHQL